MTGPNVDPLTAAHERMERAIDQQIETGLMWEAQGYNVGVFSIALAPFRALWTGNGTGRAL